MTAAQPTVALSILFLLLSVATTQTAHSRRKSVGRTVNRYDRTVTEFDPNGRLLQTEYSEAAVLRSQPVLSVRINSTIYVITSAGSSSLQRVDDTKLMVSTGLAADARLMAQQLRIRSLNHQLSFGESITNAELSKALLELQHRFTIHQGFRPLAVSTMLISTCHPPNDDSCLMVCSPTTIPVAVRYCAMGKKQEELMKRLNTLYETILSSSHSHFDIVSRLLALLSRRFDSKLLFDVWVLPITDQSLVVKNHNTTRFPLMCYRNVGDKRSLTVLKERLDQLAF